MSARWRVPPWMAVVGAVVSFSLLIDTTGLIPTVISTVLIASRGSREATLREALILGVCLAVATALLFVALLGQPFHLVGSW